MRENYLQSEKTDALKLSIKVLPQKHLDLHCWGAQNLAGGTQTPGRHAELPQLQLLSNPVKQCAHACTLFFGTTKEIEPNKGPE